jgi:hypothetical protein
VSDYTRPATWEDLKALAQYLEQAGVEYAVIGGYGLALQGIARFTEDVDILVNPSADNSRRWILALSRLPDGAARELASDPDVFAGAPRGAVRINDEFTVDILPSAAGHDWSELAPHIVRVAIDDAMLNVLDLEGLLKTKQTERLKDRVDAQAIQRALDELKRVGR